MAKSMRFRVLGGKHISDGKVYQKGDVVVSATDLAEKFANKFERLDGKTSLSEDHDSEAFSNAEVLDDPQKTIKKLGKEAKEAAPKRKKLPTELESELGENVTEDFEVAGENGLVVFKDGKSFYVTEPEDVENALNDKPLKQSQVGDFIDEYSTESSSKDDEEEDSEDEEDDESSDNTDTEDEDDEDSEEEAPPAAPKKAAKKAVAKTAKAKKKGK